MLSTSVSSAVPRVSPSSAQQWADFRFDEFGKCRLVTHQCPDLVETFPGLHPTALHLGKHDVCHVDTKLGRQVRRCGLFVVEHFPDDLSATKLFSEIILNNVVGLRFDCLAGWATNIPVKIVDDQSVVYRIAAPRLS